MKTEIEADRVYKLWHLLEVGAHQYGLCAAELQKDEGVFYLVAEWQMTHDGEVPRLRLPLDPQFIRATRHLGEFKYLLPIRASEMAKLYSTVAS